MAAPGSEEHRERARRAQQLSDRAREQAGGERAAAERSEHLMVDATGSGLRELPRQAADLHRQALHHYEEAAQLQQLHAEHERSAAERAVAMETAGGGDLGATADRRDSVADERDHHAEVREAAADEREPSSWRTSANGGRTTASVVSTKRPAVGRRATAISWLRPRAPWIGSGRGWDGMTQS